MKEKNRSATAKIPDERKIFKAAKTHLQKGGYENYLSKIYVREAGVPMEAFTI